jgi:isopenicillin-N N-acyltransferase like protein
MHDSPQANNRKLRELTVMGSPSEIGYQHGRAFAVEIQRFLDDDLARINSLRERPLSRENALRAAGQYAKWIEREVPDVADEIAGIARGSNIDYLEAVLLQIRREIVADHTASECTAIGRWTDTSCLLAQTVDLAGNMGDLALILKVVPLRPDSPAVCMFTFIGLCGYLGLNESGLAICINMIQSPGWRPGVSPYALMRHLLSKASVAEALDEIQRIHRASSRFFMLADWQGLVGVEMTVNDHRTLNARRLVHTNHFIHRDFTGMERNTRSGLANSRLRFDRASKLFADGDVPEVILRDHENFPRSICSHNQGSIRVPCTVGAVILKPREQELLATAGLPCQNLFETFSIRGMRA